ncbi:DUF1206 domain-containing protein [Rubricoccus marinus]|uniref:DUF1206 domain-containing protein n=1 Tax=Rubricoccus marinus TaxID=716817 RepID=A0A259U365_9BACT|nr:DUF1206 domain-containing protein [Rubricoccus marinus]OZC04436.1 hypothetical protein BSZ36_16475 [Rubricoccus marinus]
MSTLTSRASNRPMETAGRIGYAFKGVLYVLLGVLAVQAALSGGDAEGQTGALRAVADNSFGGILLALLAVGLGAYSLWRLATAILDPENHGTDASGLVHRVGYFASAVAYGYFAFVAGRLVWGSGGGGEGGGASEQAQTAFGLPGGRWLVALAACALLGFAAREAYRAYSAKFMQDLALDGIGQDQRHNVERLGRAGLAARAVVYGLLGASLAVAAWQTDASEAMGLDAALDSLRQAPYGVWVLAAVGLGLAAYGLYCGVMAKYKRIENA